MSRALTALFLLLAAYQSAAAQLAAAAKIVQPSEPSRAAQPRQEPAPLTNADVLTMVEAQLAPAIIVEKLRVSPRDLDTSPAALRALKEAGVPDALLLVMVMSPKCAALAAAPVPPRRVAVQVPVGTPVELETAYTINSQLVRAAGTGGARDASRG